MGKVLAVLALFALAGCGARHGGVGASAPRSAGQIPGRRAGLWEETISRDGRPLAEGGKLEICLDAATDAKVGIFGREAAGSLCRQRSVVRLANGDYRFSSTCTLGKAGVITSHGLASGDFSSSYRVDSESTVSGASIPPLNGHHRSLILARYAGPCSADMSPGDMLIDGDVKVNVNRLGQGVRALSSIEP
ncbi:MAG: DUF3617 domain-containing protein [Caulobacteraceae bacterium]